MVQQLAMLLVILNQLVLILMEVALLSEELEMMTMDLILVMSVYMNIVVEVGHN